MLVPTLVRHQEERHIRHKPVEDEEGIEDHQDQGLEAKHQHEVNTTDCRCPGRPIDLLRGDGACCVVTELHGNHEVSRTATDNAPPPNTKSSIFNHRLSWGSVLVRSGSLDKTITVASPPFDPSFSGQYVKFDKTQLTLCLTQCHDRLSTMELDPQAKRHKNHRTM